MLVAGKVAHVFAGAVPQTVACVARVSSLVDADAASVAMPTESSMSVFAMMGRAEQMIMPEHEDQRGPCENRCPCTNPSTL